MNRRASYSIQVSTPLGVFTLGVTEKGVASILWPGSGERVSATRLRGRGSDLARQHAERAARELEGYWGGEIKRFETPVDLTGATPFEKDVYTALASVRFGETTSYGELARLSGHPGSARAVGGALGRNRAPIFVPCHRVITSAGRLGGWSGPEGWKERLLAHEGSTVLED